MDVSEEFMFIFQWEAYLVLALEAGYHVVAKDIGAGLGVQAGEERSGGDDTHVGVVEALVGAKRVKTANGSAIDEAGRNVVELMGC